MNQEKVDGPTAFASGAPPEYPQPTYANGPQNQPQQQPIPPAQTPAVYKNEHYPDTECAQGRHQRTTTFGLCGIITAIFCFPIGLICLCIDSEKKCSRCGARM